jgi:hypothetical protein
MVHEQDRAAAEAALQAAQEQFTALQGSFRELVQAAARRQNVSAAQAGTYVPDAGTALGMQLPGEKEPAEHLSVIGLEHRLARTTERLAELKASIRAAVVQARRSGYTTEEPNATLEALGLEPLREVTRVTVSELSFTVAEETDAEKAAALVTEAFQKLLGDGVTVDSVEVEVTRETV